MKEDEFDKICCKLALQFSNIVYAFVDTIVYFSVWQFHSIVLQIPLTKGIGNIMENSVRYMVKSQ